MNQQRQAPYSNQHAGTDNAATSADTSHGNSSIARSEPLANSSTLKTNPADDSQGASVTNNSKEVDSSQTAFSYNNGKHEIRFLFDFDAQKSEFQIEI